MKLTKHEHACVVLEKDGAKIVIDPGSFSSGAAEIIAGVDAILVTHEVPAVGRQSSQVPVQVVPAPAMNNAAGPDAVTAPSAADR